MSSYDFNHHLHPHPLQHPNPPHPSQSQSQSNMHPDYPPYPTPPLPHEEPLSLFQQTMREKDEEFYTTFPAARLAYEAQSHTPHWRRNYTRTGLLPGCGFQLSAAPLPPNLTLQTHPEYVHPPPHSLHPASPQSPSSYGLGTSHPTHQPVGFHHAPTQDSRHTGYAASPVTPPIAQHEFAPNVATAPLHIATSAFDSTYRGQFHHQQQQSESSPVMDSLTSDPDALADTETAFRNLSPGATMPQQVFYSPTPPSSAFSTLSSPIDQESPVPISPPALVQATYHYETNLVNGIKSEPEQQQYCAVPQPSPKLDPSVLPSRRNSQPPAHRSKQRYPPKYSRSAQYNKSGAKSGGSASEMEALNWSQSTPALAIGGDTADDKPAVAAAGTATNAPPAPVASSSTSTLIVTSRSAPSLTPISPAGGSSPNKRPSDKKPALACVFCRGRKIACGAPLKDSDGKTCNQCQRRSLRCEYPTESRRGMRKKPATPNTNPDGPQPATSRKR